MSRWLIDDAGSLIDTYTGDVYDYVDELADILNWYDNTFVFIEKVLSL